MSDLTINVHKIDGGGDALTSIEFSMNTLRLKTYFGSPTMPLVFEILDNPDSVIEDIHGLLSGYKYLTVGGYTWLIQMLTENEFNFVTKSDLMRIFTCFQKQGAKLDDKLTLIQNITKVNAFYEYEYYESSEVHEIGFSQHIPPCCSLKELCRIPVSGTELSQVTCCPEIEFIFPEKPDPLKDKMEKLGRAIQNHRENCKPYKLQETDESFILEVDEVNLEELATICDVTRTLLKEFNYDFKTNLKNERITITLPKE